MKYILSPSILAADFKELVNQIQATEKGGAEYLHYDVMDGFFVPSISFGMPVLKSIKPCTKQVMDVHLMIKEPIRYIEEFVKSLLSAISSKSIEATNVASTGMTLL